MTEYEQKQLKMDNLIYKLMALATTKKTMIDTLYAMEVEGEKLRAELLKEMHSR